MNRYIARVGFLLFLLCAGGTFSVNAACSDAGTAEGSQLLIPKESGKKQIKEERITIDFSNTDQGYLMVRYEGGADDIYVQLTGPDGVAYKYFVTPEEETAAIPFTSGDGEYEILVYENVEGNQYMMMIGETLEVTLENEFLPFLYSNQYVNFSEDSKAVAKAAELAEGEKDKLAILKKIYYFVINELTYDDEKADTVESGYLPVVDETLKTKKGICFDYAALMTAMLRSQGIPTKLDIGYTGGNIYHAWISIWLEKYGWVDIIKIDGKSWKLMDPTFASCDNNSEEIQEYISDSENYVVRYIR